MPKKFLRKISLFFLPLFVLLFIFLEKPQAGTISSISVNLSESGTSATSSYTIQFTPQSNVPPGGLVLISFIHPGGASFDLSSATLNAATSSEITAVDTSNAANNFLSFNTSGLTGGAAYTIKVDNITNPSTAGMCMLAVATQSEGSYIDGNLEASLPQVLSPSFQVGTAAFRGQVTDPSNNPVFGAWVNAFPSASTGGQPQGSSTNYNGDYLIPSTNISTGDYDLEVFPPQSGSGSNLISPDRVTQSYSGSTIIQDFQFLPATKTITGKVTYSSGGNVANANINAFKMNGVAFVQTTTNASGDYTLSVSGGDWEVMPQATAGSDWAYGDPPTSVKFPDDTSSESKTVNFTVERATATITGRVVRPDGSALQPSDGIGGVGFFSMEGKGGGGQVDSNGNFSINVPAGTYMFDVWAPPDSNYGSPQLDPISIKDGETRNLGTIRLVEKDATITGSVRTEGGTGVASVEVNAFVRDGSGFSMAQTDGSGNFTMRVAAGRWMVMPLFGPTSSYALEDPPQEVSVASGGSASVNFTVKSATAAINGTVVDSNNSLVSVYGFAFAEKVGGGMFGPSGLGGPIERGSFSFKVPAGSYTVNVGLAPGTGYTPGDGTSVTIADGETQNITVTVKTNDAKISGSIIDQNGNPVSTSQLSVFAVSDNHAFQEGMVAGSSYEINISSGEWTLGYFIDPASGYMSAPPDPSLKFSVASGATVTRNITLQRADATISGKVYQSDGSTPAVGVFVSVDNRETEGKEFINGASTDTNGDYTIPIASGTYKVRANVAPGQGYLSPPEQTVAIGSGEVKTVNFTLRQSDASISGRVTLGGSGVAAFVYAYSDDGAFAQTQANSSGDYTLSVSQGTTWYVGARYESGTTPYEATETTVNMTGSSTTVNLILSQLSYSLPQSLTATFDATKPKLITLTDGTKINIPASALASSGNVTLRINPKASLPSKKGDKPVWYGYDFSATDANGQTITKFNSSITITFPYTDGQLNTLGITADDLIPSYWDETSGTWKKVDNVTVNTTAKTVTITIDHFTDFALTANIAVATTTAPPAAPSPSIAIAAVAAGGESPPEIYANQGAVIKRNKVIVIVEPGTLPWDSYLSLTLYPKKHPYHIGTFWQVSAVYDLWFRAFFNEAKILNPDKASVIAIRYTSTQLENLPEQSLKIAQSLDEGKTWRILSTSVLDRENKTVAGLSKIRGYYMLVAGYGGYGGDYGRKKAEVVTDEKERERIIEEEKKAAPEEERRQIPLFEEEKRLRPTPAPAPKPKKSLLQKIFDLILNIFRRR